MEKSVPWLSGQPDNWMGTEDYASISVDTKVGKMELNDRNEGRSFSYVCEVIYLANGI